MKQLHYFVVLLCAVQTTSVGSASHPNVLLICVDDLKPAIGCFGDRQAKTPNIDKLASRGVLFERAFCNQAVCSPSRNALMTSLRPQTIGIYDLPTHFRNAAPNAVTLGQYLKSHGYRAEGLGKILHTGHGNIDDADSWSVPSWRPKGGNYALKSSTEDSVASKNGPKGAAYESADVPDNQYNDGMVADEAIERLRAAKERKDQPFFIAVGFVKPHLPFVAPKKYWDMHDRNAFELASIQGPPTDAPSYAPQQGGELRNYKDIPGSGTLPPELQRTLIHGYYAATSYMDAQAGRVLDELDRLQFTQNTIVVLWGDHGWHLGDHGIWCKHTNYEQAARIPVIVSAPGIKAGVKSKSLIETVDLYPTIAELAGLPAPQGLDGKSFVQALQDGTKPAREYVSHVYPRSTKEKGNLLGRAIRDERYRFVEWKKPGDAPETAEFELYDYISDPLESANLASKLPAVVASFRSILAKHPEAKPRWQAGSEDSAKSTSASKPKQDRVQMFRRRDKDKDGRLTKEEFLSEQSDPDEAPKRFLKFDANGDGFLSQDEFVFSGKSNN